MSKGIYVALSGAVAQENALDVTATNIANASSPGFQRLRPVFREAMSRANKRDAGLHYAATSRTELDTTAGATRVTGRSLDVALPNGTYLAVTSPRGERYTRSGALTVDDTGVVKASGAPLATETGEPIKAKLDGGEVKIDPDGTIRQGDGAIGKMKLVKFEKPQSLLPEGGSLLAVGEAGTMTPAGPQKLEVGALEESNAKPITGMTEMMTVTRTFEAFQKVLDQFSEIDRKLLTTVPNAVE